MAIPLGFLLSEPDQIPVLDPSVGPGRRDHIERFQNVGLALRVVSVEDVRPFGEREAERLIVSEIR